MASGNTCLTSPEITSESSGGDCDQTANSQGIGGYIYGLLSRSLSRKQDKTLETTDTSHNMATVTQPKSDPDQYDTTQFQTSNAEDGFLNVEMKLSMVIMSFS